MSEHLSAGDRVLVTGAGGFIGSHLCRRLRELGCDVHEATRANADLADLDAARALFATVRPASVCHLAAHVAGARGLELVPSTFAGNLQATVNVLVAAHEAGCRRIVLAGSMEEPVRTAAPAVPSSPYSASKWAASGYARMFHALYGSPVVILRVFMVYGPGQRDEGKLVPYTTLSLLRGEAPQLTSGSRAVDWVYVGDVVEAFVRALQAARVEGSTIDIGSGTPVTVRELVARLVSLIDDRIEPVFGAIPDRALETSPVADLRSAESLLGWRPTTTLDDGLRQTVDWYAGRLGIELPGRSA